MSPVPIHLAQIYQEEGILPSNIEFYTSSVLELSRDFLNEFSSSLVITDVLGYYLSPREYRNLVGWIWNSLTLNGLWITRELVEPFGSPLPEKRTIGGDQFEEFGLFLDNYFPGYEFTNQDRELLMNRWALVNTYPRVFFEDYDSAKKGLMDLQGSISATNTLDWSRIFITSVYAPILDQEYINLGYI
ncbi:hypothetical protein JXB41_03600 [Candidatus Woesearchaeota archaeon]|nr:hypothetical protein [Candidatus Woesearchaeota archaeon]